MSFQSQQFHPASLASDTTDYQANTLVRLTQAVTRGLPAAAASGAVSIYNTVVANRFTGISDVDTENLLRKYGSNAMGDYYKDNQEAIDTVGFVGTALIPGSLGIKGLNVLRSGNGAGNFGKFLGIPATKKSQYLEQALQEVAKDGGAVKGILSSSARRKQLGWETADQALNGAAFELAVAATMNNSPIFDNSSLSDFGWNFALGTGLSAAIGGPIGSIAASGILKNAATEVQAQLRLADLVTDPQKLGLLAGTDALLMAESIANLPTKFDNIPFTYLEGGKRKSIELETAGAISAAKDSAERLGTEKLKLKFNEIAQGNELVGQALFEALQRGAAASKSSGFTPTETIRQLNGYLNMLSKVKAVDPEQVALEQRKFYLVIDPTGLPREERGLLNMFSLKRKVGKDGKEITSKQPYYLADNVLAEDLRIASMADLPEDNIKAAFKNNPNVDAILIGDGSYRINPKSSRILKFRENPNTTKMLMDLESLQLTPETVLAFGDIIPAGKLLTASDAIYAGARAFRQGITAAVNITTEPLQSSARYAWAAGQNFTDLRRTAGGIIHTSDLPVIDRLVELLDQGLVKEDTLRTLQFFDGEKYFGFDDIVNFRALPEQMRLEVLETQLAKLGGQAVPDSRSLAIHMNTSREWVESAIESGFQRSKKDAPLFPTKLALQPRTVQMEWDFTSLIKNKNVVLPEEAYNMNMGPNHLWSKEISKEYQREIARKINVTAADTVLGVENAALIPQEADFIGSGSKFGDRLSSAATAQGAGATLFGASNAGYGEAARLFVQELGKNVALISQRLRDAVIDTLAPNVNALRESPRASAELGILTTALRKSPYRFVFDDTAIATNRIISEEAQALAKRMKGDTDAALAQLEVAGKPPHSFTIQSQEVENFLRASTAINATRQGKFTTLYNATGLVKAPINPQAIYVPPINTVKYPYHAFVKTKEKVGIPSNVGMITAKDEDQLRALAAQVGDDYDVFFKQNTDNYFKAKGEYEYQNTLNEAAVNSDLARRNILADFFPETRLENIMTDWLEWHAKQEEKLVRTAVQVKNREFFSDMNFLSEQYRKVSESVTRGIGSQFRAKVADPFGDYVKTALNISKQQEFPLLDSLNDFIDKLSLSAGEAMNKGFRDAKAGLISWEEASEIAGRYGLGKPYADLDTYLTANERMPVNVIRTFLQKANAALATTTLRLDFFNSLVNIISTPIMLGTEMASVRGMMARDPAAAGKLAELMTVKVPGKDFAVPSTTKLIAQSVGNFFSENKAALISRYEDIGAIKKVTQLYHEMLDVLSFQSTITPNKMMERVNAGVEKAAKITGNTFSEDFTRFISADVMRQMTDPLVEVGRMTVKEQNAYISTFVNRVQGNYVTSQRPIVFQGTAGAAVSLFQTYAFNVLQQLHRHMQRGDKRTLAVFAGLQSTIFGMNGLPFFDATNTYILGKYLADNPEHKDAYSVLPSFNKELGDWLLYGTASAFPLFSGSMPALFTRGDINPRHITILPTNIVDVPAVSASIKLAEQVYEFGKNVSGGADLSNAMLRALEHQGWNRPLAGFAQVLAGRTTTSTGSLISAANEFETTAMLTSLQDRLVDFGGVTRLLGSRPMDEAVALNALYREKRYEAMDKARIERLGEVVKSKLYSGEAPSDEEYQDFMLRYARSGGRVETFNQAYMRWTRDANESVVNQMLEKHKNPFSQKLFEIMGGEPLPE